MRLWLTLSFIFVFFVTCQERANSQIVRYDFTGTINTLFDNDPNASPDAVYGAVGSSGSPVVGFFTFDASAPASQTVVGVNGEGTGNGFEFNSPFTLSVTFGGVTFENDGIYAAVVFDDFRQDAAFPIFDTFSIGDGTQNPSPGTTILANGVQETGELSILFNDNTANVLSSPQLPSSLDVNSFSFIEGRVEGTDSNGIFGLATFGIDSIQVSSVPEPSTGVLFCGVMLTAFCRRLR